VSFGKKNVGDGWAIAVMRRVAIGSFAVALAGCLGASPAVAAPRGGYAVFAQCPIGAVGVDGCIYGSLEGGYIALGKEVVVPISRTVVLQGGLLEEQEPFVKHLAGAVNGETLTRVRQAIPGLAGTLDAVAELAAPAGSVSVNDAGGNVRLPLPVKIRLEPGLGPECSIGSDAHPIEMNLTSTTSGALKGNPGKQSSFEEGGILLKSGVTLVDSGFAVPKATGCGSTSVDTILDAILGLPSSTASAKFNFRLEAANSELVEEAEG
jgi:hypothetical protein